MKLNVLLVDDDPGDLLTYLRDFPEVFRSCGVDATFYPTESFDEALRQVESSHIRYDLILSDTFRGDQKNRDAAVIAMVQRYRAGRFCPLVVFSASGRPDALVIGAFVAWADKSARGEIESTIRKILATGI